MTVLAGAAAWQWRDAVAQRTAAVAAKNEADAQKAVAIQAKNDAIAQKAQADQAKTEALAQKATAEHTLALATDAANSLVFDIAQKFRDGRGSCVADQEHSRSRAGLAGEIARRRPVEPSLLRSEAVGAR